MADNNLKPEETQNQGKEAPKHCWRKRFKWLAGTVAIITAIGGVASNLNSIGDFLQKLQKSEPQQKNLVIVPNGELAWSEDKLLEDSYFNISDDEDHHYSLAIHIRGKFGNQQFNKREYFRSLSTLKTSIPDHLKGEQSVKQPIEFDLDGADKLSSLAPFFISLEGIEEIEQSIAHPTVAHRTAETLNWTVFLKTREKPPKDAMLELSAGPLNWKVPLGRQQWKQYPVKSKAISSTWWGAQGTLLLSFPDPDWVILREARLLKGIDPDSSLLEVTIENRGIMPVVFSNLVLRASHPSKSMSSCYKPPEWQEVHLNWSRVIEKTGDVSASAAWTKLSDARVNVGTRFRNGSCSGYDHRFDAVVPIQLDITPNELGRLTVHLHEAPLAALSRGRPSWCVEQLSIEECTQLASGYVRKQPGEFQLGLPERLIEWHKLRIALHPSDHVYPSVVQAAKP